MILQRGAVLEALAANSAPIREEARRNLFHKHTDNQKEKKKKKKKRKMQMQLTESHSSTQCTEFNRRSTYLAPAAENGFFSVL